MADGVKDFKFRVRVQDDTKAGMMKAQKNVSAMAKQTQRKTSTLISPRAGKAMGAFNEKTEKGRQLLMALGGAAGGAAGNVVYYTGTLSYVIGTFSRWQFGIMGVVGGLSALAYSIFATSEEQKRYNKIVEESEKRTRKLNSEIERRLRIEEGRTAAEVDFDLAYEELEGVRGLIEQRRQALEEYRKAHVVTTAAGPMVATEKEREFIEQLENDIRALEARLPELEARARKTQLDLDIRYKKRREREKKKFEEQQKREREARMPDKEGGAARVAGTPPGEMPMDEASEYYSEMSRLAKKKREKELREQQMQQERRRRMRERWLHKMRRLEIQGASAVDRVQMEYADKRREIIDTEMATEEEKERALLELKRQYAERLFELQKTEAERRSAEERREQEESLRRHDEAARRAAAVERYKQRMWSMSTDAVGNLGSAVAAAMELAGASEEKQMRAVAAFTAITDTINAAHEIAEAIAAFASYRYAEGAQHVAAAAAYTASAALAAAKAGGAVGGGGGAKGGAGGVYAGGPSPTERQAMGGDQDKRGGGVTIIVDGNLYSGRDTMREIRDGIEELEYSENPAKPRKKVS